MRRTSKQHRRGHRTGRPPQPAEATDVLPDDRTERLDARSFMTARELDPRSIQGDRFDPGDPDVSYQPDLEEDPGAPSDIVPDQVRAMPGTRQAEEGTDGSAEERAEEASPPVLPADVGEE